jgi:hypothetical protein
MTLFTKIQLMAKEQCVLQLQHAALQYYYITSKGTNKKLTKMEVESSMRILE